MTYLQAKEKLHGFIDAADENTVMKLLQFVEHRDDSDMHYDEETMNILRERSAAYKSGNSRTYSVEESMDRMKNKRNYATPSGFC